MTTGRINQVTTVARPGGPAGAREGAESAGVTGWQRDGPAAGGALGHRAGLRRRLCAPPAGAWPRPRFREGAIRFPTPQFPRAPSAALVRPGRPLEEFLGPHVLQHGAAICARRLLSICR